MGAFAALGVILVPAGTAKPPASEVKKYDACLQDSNGAPACSTGADTVLPGGSSVKLKLTITNQRTSNQSLGSVNLDVPSGSGIEIDVTKLVEPSTGNTVVPQSSSQIQLRNLSLAPDTSMNVTFYVTTPCSGTDLRWGIATKQSNNFLGTGNDFSLINATGLKTDIQGCYRVEFINQNQPKSTVVGATITDDVYSRGGPIKVGLFDNNDQPVTVCPSGATCSVTVSKDVPAGTLGGILTQNLVGNPLVATFNDLSIGGLSENVLPKTYTLKASGLGTEDTSDAFDVIYGVPCTTSGCPVFNTSLSSTSHVDASATGSSFTFLAVIPATIPTDVTSSGGCANYRGSAGGVFEAIDGRTSDGGELRFTYYVNKKDIDKLYGSSQGQQFIPLCAGAAWVNSSGAVKRCGDAGAPDPWVGKELGTDGKFTGALKNAVCDGTTGLFWGILGSFQDYTGSNTIDPNTSPTVTGWDSNGTYRYFHVRVPAPWDWKMG